MSATSCSARASSPHGWEGCSCSSPIWCVSTRDALALGAKLPGSRMIPAGHALRASLALKLWSIERKSHVMALVADEGLALFCGLNAMPKKSFLSEYSSRITPQKVSRLLALLARAGHRRGSLHRRSRSTSTSTPCPTSASIRSSNPTICPSAAAASPASSPSWPRTPTAQVFCYSNADIRKGEEAEEVFRFIDFWKRQYGSAPQHLVFDSKLTTYDGLDRLDAAGITFLTLRRRSPKPARRRSTTCRHRPGAPSPSTYSSRKYRTPRFYEQKARPQKRTFRQFFITDLGHDEPTILLTNDTKLHRQAISSPATPSACSSRTRSPMRCASSTSTRSPHRSASRSTSTWRSSSSPQASIA